MKTFDLSMQQNAGQLTPVLKRLYPIIATSVRTVLALAVAVSAAVAVIALSAWSASLEISIYVGASIWGLGLIFLALAVDSRGLVAFYQTFSGLALLVFAMLQSTVSPDFVIASGALLSAWVGIPLFNLLSYWR